jgi:hypothetical protein
VVRWGGGTPTAGLLTKEHVVHRTGSNSLEKTAARGENHELDTQTEPAAAPPIHTSNSGAATHPRRDPIERRFLGSRSISESRDWPTCFRRSPKNKPARGGLFPRRSGSQLHPNASNSSSGLRRCHAGTFGPDKINGVQIALPSPGSDAKAVALDPESDTQRCGPSRVWRLAACRTFQRQRLARAWDFGEIFGQSGNHAARSFSL